jgi:HK97 family phage major capsid protein
MAFDTQTTRTGAQALMPEDVASEILGTVAEESVVMSLARRLPNMSRKQRRLPVWSTLPNAYFVNGDTGRKQTTNVSWDNVYINAEEIAVIAPIPEAVLDDADYDIWAEAKPAIVSAIGAAFDRAVLYGINAPALWPECIVEGAEAAGHEVTIGEVGDLYSDIMGENGVLNLVEVDGYMVTGHVAALGMRAKLRDLRDNEDRPIFVSGLMSEGKTVYSLDGQELKFPRNGAIDPSRTLLISGDWSQLVYAIRQDITYKVLTEAVIDDGAGAIVFNLAQQDMVALRVVFRVGWALPNPVNLVNTNSATRYPFAFLEPVAAS